MTATFTSAEAAAGSNKLRTEIIFKKVLDIKIKFLLFKQRGYHSQIIAKMQQNFICLYSED